jgi:hypothetical protein
MHCTCLWAQRLTISVCSSAMANTDQRISLPSTLGTKSNDNVKRQTNTTAMMFSKALDFPVDFPTDRRHPTPARQSLLSVPLTNPSLSIVNLNRVRLGSKHRLVAQKRLSTRANALQKLLVRQALALDEVREELVDVAAEAVDLLAAGRQEGKHRHVAVGALVHVPGVAFERGAGDGHGLAFGRVGAGDELSVMPHDAWKSPGDTPQEEQKLTSKSARR